jgi:hypothetical protein
MHDRVDEYLSGKVRRQDLTDVERANVEAVERAIDATRGFLGACPGPDVTAAVLRRIEIDPGPAAARPGVLQRLVGSLWHPVQIAIRPAYVLAGSALLGGLLVSPLASRAPGVAPPAVAATPPLFVQFRLEATASSVQLIGSFTGWERRYELHETAPGLWSITVPLAEGVHDYAFLLDGRQWVVDPYASQVSDGFGGTNSRLTLLLPTSPAQS